MVRALLAAAALVLAAACAPAPNDEQIANRQSCLVMLRFSSDAERAAFLLRNVEMIVSQASSVDMVASSSPISAETALLTAASCATFNENQSGLDLGAATVVSATDKTFEGAARDLLAAFGQPPSWTDTDAHQCVVRLAPTGDHIGRMMNAMALSGLRNASVNGVDDALFGTYDESCALVRSYIQTALVVSEDRASASAFCENASLRQCGYEGGGFASAPVDQ